MGCMYSKAITRSMSIREELSHGIFHNSSSSAAWEELILTSHSGNNNNNEHLFALAAKLRTSNFTLPSMEPVKAEAESAPGSVTELDYGRFTRSKSCQIFGDDREIPSPENENKLDRKDKSMGGSRSFHTVEEYDSLLERIRKSNTNTVEYPSEEGFSSLRNSDASENILQENGTRENGWRRKAVAKGLKSLDVPPVEFPSAAKFRQRINAEGQVYSPGSYITPKFGSYNDAKATRAKREKNGGENPVFSPELVAAFEDCMQQLQMEEEIFLQRVDRYSPEDDVMENHLESSTKHESLIV
ncbi:hypothetical protein ABFS83_13G140200 [Erythranthe nasuta]